MPTNEQKMKFIQSLLDFAERQELKAQSNAEAQQSAASEEPPQAEKQPKRRRTKKAKPQE